MSTASTPVEPLVFKIGNYFIGGPRGQYPTTLMLSLFHQGDRLVSDHKSGQFDQTRVKRLIHRAIKLRDITGNPFMLDVLAETPKAMVNYLTFLDEAAPSIPFLIDSSSLDARLAGLQHTANSGRNHLAIYDSITQQTTEDEINALRKAKITAAILLAYNPLDLYPQGRLEVLQGSNKAEGLLTKAKRAGITKPLVDTVALDLAGLAIAAAAIPIIKNTLGLPAGAGSANSVALWNRAKFISPAAKRYLAPALCTYLQYAGANFILPGPLRRAPRFFTTTAVTDGLLAFAPPEGPYPPDPPKIKQHPRYTTL